MLETARQDLITPNSSYVIVVNSRSGEFESVGVSVVQRPAFNVQRPAACVGGVGSLGYFSEAAVCIDPPSNPPDRGRKGGAGGAEHDLHHRQMRKMRGWMAGQTKPDLSRNSRGWIFIQI